MITDYVAEKAQPSTSALGSMLGKNTNPVTLFGTILDTWGTNSNYNVLAAPDSTTSGPEGYLLTPICLTPICADEQSSVAAAVMEIRRLSGLTWDELADLFSVTRRSLHHWANGKVVNAAHDNFIRDILIAIRHISRGDAASTRALLRTKDASGISVLDLLRNKKTDDAIARATPTKVTLTPRLTPLAADVSRARHPASPVELLEALQDLPDTTGRAISAKFSRMPKKSRT